MQSANFNPLAPPAPVPTKKGEQDSNGRQLRRGPPQASSLRMPSSPSINVKKEKSDQRESQECRDSGGGGDSDDDDDDTSSTDSDDSPVVWLERAKRVNIVECCHTSPAPGATRCFLLLWLVLYLAGCIQEKSAVNSVNAFTVVCTGAHTHFCENSIA